MSRYISIFILFFVSTNSAVSAVISSSIFTEPRGATIQSFVDTDRRIGWYELGGLDTFYHGFGPNNDVTAVFNLVAQRSQLELDNIAQLNLEQNGVAFLLPGGSTFFALPGNPRRGWFSAGFPELVEKGGTPFGVELTIQSITKCTTCYAGFAWNAGFKFAGFADTLFGLNGNDYTVQGPTLTAVVVPLPGAVWLFSSGLIGLVGFANRRSNANTRVKLMHLTNLL